MLCALYRSLLLRYVIVQLHKVVVANATRIAYFRDCLSTESKGASRITWGLLRAADLCIGEGPFKTPGCVDDDGSTLRDVPCHRT
jgi:hypothetical protein